MQKVTFDLVQARIPSPVTHFLKQLGNYISSCKGHIQLCSFLLIIVYHFVTNRNPIGP